MLEGVEADRRQPLLDGRIGDDPPQLLLRRSTIGLGVCAGAKIAFQGTRSSGQPASVIDGTSGRSALRSLVVTASAHIAGFGLRRAEREVDEHHRDAARHHVVDRLRGGSVRHVDEIEAGHPLEGGAGDQADGVAGIAELAGIGLHGMNSGTEVAGMRGSMTSMNGSVPIRASG